MKKLWSHLGEVFPDQYLMGDRKLPMYAIGDVDNVNELLPGDRVQVEIGTALYYDALARYTQMLNSCKNFNWEHFLNLYGFNDDGTYKAGLNQIIFPVKINGVPRRANYNGVPKGPKVIRSSQMMGNFTVLYMLMIMKNIC